MNEFQIFGIAAIAAAVGLSACGVSQIDETPKNNNAQLAQTASSAAETPQTPVAEFDPDNFTTEGKPTKTIETPWGPRKVYDPAQDPSVAFFFKKWRDGQYAGASFPSEWAEVIYEAKRVQALDYARHQCMRQAFVGGCYEVDFVFKRNCDGQQNFHSKTLTSCESENYVTLWNSENKCRFQKGYSFSHFNAATLKQSLQNYFHIDCLVWRGQSGDGYWKKDIALPNQLPRSR